MRRVSFLRLVLCHHCTCNSFRTIKKKPSKEKSKKGTFQKERHRVTIHTDWQFASPSERISGIWLNPLMLNILQHTRANGGPTPKIIASLPGCGPELSWKTSRKHIVALAHHITSNEFIVEYWCQIITLYSLPFLSIVA